MTCLVLTIGCEEPPVDEPDAGTDASDMCTRDEHCTNDVFCDGIERCEPARAEADARGCVPSVAPACSDGATCDEEEARCDTGPCTGDPDVDGDGVDSIACGGTDCDDGDPMRFPGATEVCDPDDRDEDCDPRTFGVRDGDGDGSIDAACCNASADGMRCGDDCDDSRPTAHPGATEACDTFDNDCDGTVDEGVRLTFFRDEDHDGYGVDGDTQLACGPDATYGATRGGDCDDGEPFAAPSTVEVCDGIDNDCDGAIDDGALPQPWFLDDDGDNYGAPSATPVVSCAPIPRYVLNDDDCDDTRATVSPAGIELCNGLDDDCDGMIDELLLAELWFDGDGDGWGDPATGVVRCPGPGWVMNGGDCDDTQRLRAPDEPEVCDGLDNDCNGALDAFGEDDDGDNHADDACAGFGGSDCNDTDPTIHRGAPEPCNGVDNACDGGVEDGDGDGHAPPSAACTATATFLKDDCDDTNAMVHGGRSETCDGIDNDCDTSVDEPPASTACAAPNATAACVVGTCVRSCNEGFADCNGAAADGCEVDLRATPAHCGGCGLACGIASECSGRLCDDVVQMVAGDQHACALRANGRVVCWGKGTSGELGNGAMANSDAPVEVVGIDDATRVASHSQHVCVVRSTGQVWCWGRNAHGELGDGTMTSSPIPVRALGITGATQVATGGNHTCALVSGGAVRCWGRNGDGQLGDNTVVTPRLSSVAVMGLPAGVTAITAGLAYSCALAGGAVYCWGDDSRGQIGNDATLADRATATQVSGLSDAIQIAGGGSHVCVVRSGGTARCWGWGIAGQLGHGATGTSGVPVDVTGLTSLAEISAGTIHSCARRATGALWCWGNDGNGRLGDGMIGTPDTNSTPIAITSVADAIEVDAGGAHTCVRRASGTFACWGWNSSGQLGAGDVADSPSPRRVLSLPADVEVQVGGQHACARRASGELACWGGNGAGQIGDGTTTRRTTAVAVWGIDDAIDLALGDAHTCVVRAGGSVRCWGNNIRGEVGDGTMVSPRTTPVAVGAISDALSIESLYRHTCVRRASGGVSCWGDGDAGQIGDGAMSDRPAPVAVVGLPAGARELATGDSFSCARLASGVVWCWGQNNLGQLGSGATSAPRPAPAAVSGLADAIALGAGWSHACVVRAAGGLSCWGANAGGQIGDGTLTNRPAPVAVSSPPVGVVEVLGGRAHSCSRTGAGVLHCWGDGSRGQIGDGATMQRRTPTAVVGFGGAALALGVGDLTSCASYVDVAGVPAVRCWGANDEGTVGAGTFGASPVTMPASTVGLD